MCRYPAVAPISSASVTRLALAKRVTKRMTLHPTSTLQLRASGIPLYTNSRGVSSQSHIVPTANSPKPRYSASLQSGALLLPTITCVSSKAIRL